jgi:hypothetical protein
MPRRKKTAPPVALDRLVRLVAGHVPGAECTCAAYGQCECGCPNADWRSRREVALASALEYCLKKLNSHHRSRPGIPETIRNTEAIRDAGNYRTNADVEARPRCAPPQQDGF